MSDDTPSPLNNVITIDDDRDPFIRSLLSETRGAPTSTNLRRAPKLRASRLMADQLNQLEPNLSHNRAFSGLGPAYAFHFPLPHQREAIGRGSELLGSLPSLLANSRRLAPAGLPHWFRPALDGLA
jgi:hypothetical protein